MHITKRAQSFKRLASWSQFTPLVNKLFEKIEPQNIERVLALDAIAIAMSVGGAKKKERDLQQKMIH